MHAVGNVRAVVDWVQERHAFRTDITSNLAILHDQNDIINLFRQSAWMTEADERIISRSVTSCAGMTAHTVILLKPCSNQIGFLSEGRSKRFWALLALPPSDKTCRPEISSTQIAVEAVSPSGWACRRENSSFHITNALNFYEFTDCTCSGLPPKNLDLPH